MERCILLTLPASSYHRSLKDLFRGKRARGFYENMAIDLETTRSHLGSDVRGQAGIGFVTQLTRHELLPGSKFPNRIVTT